jgi:hypothetical protein
MKSGANGVFYLLPAAWITVIMSYYVLGATAEEVLSEMFRTADEFTGEAAQLDEMTLLIVRVRLTWLTAVVPQRHSLP